MCSQLSNGSREFSLTGDGRVNFQCSQCSKSQRQLFKDLAHTNLALCCCLARANSIDSHFNRGATNLTGEQLSTSCCYIMKHERRGIALHSGDGWGVMAGGRQVVKKFKVSITCVHMSVLSCHFNAYLTVKIFDIHYWKIILSESPKKYFGLYDTGCFLCFYCRGPLNCGFEFVDILFVLSNNYCDMNLWLPHMIRITFKLPISEHYLIIGPLISIK